jgi:hypothetical protein
MMASVFSGGPFHCPLTSTAGPYMSQICLFEAKADIRMSENQLLARLNFPVFGNLRQSFLAFQEGM